MSFDHPLTAQRGVFIVWWMLEWVAVFRATFVVPVSEFSALEVTRKEMRRDTEAEAEAEAASRELGYVPFAWQRYMTQRPPFVNITDPRDLYVRL